jgi:hypothetical protein
MSTGCIVSLLLAVVAVWAFFHFAPGPPHVATSDAPSQQWETITGDLNGQRIAVDIDPDSIERSADGASASVNVKFSADNIERVTYICRAPNSGILGAAIIDGKPVDLPAGSSGDGTMQRICFDHANKIAEASVTNPSPAAIQTAVQQGVEDARRNEASFLTEIAPAQRNMTLATFASTCNLRSDEWLSAFQSGYQQMIVATANKYGIGNPGLDAADAQALKITGELRTHWTCTTLSNSSTMDQLDSIEDKMTGGYH